MTCISWMLLSKAPYLACLECSPLVCCINSGGSYDTGGHKGGTHKCLNPQHWDKKSRTSQDQLQTSSTRLCAFIFLLVTFLLVSSFIEEGSALPQCSGFSVLPFLATTQLSLFSQASSVSQPALLNVPALFFTNVSPHQIQCAVNKLLT